MSGLIARIREQMRKAENYARPDTGVVRFCVLPTDINALLTALEAAESSDARLANLESGKASGSATDPSRPSLLILPRHGGEPPVCEACRGSGVIPIWDSSRRDDWHQQTCPICEGGEVPARGDTGARQTPDDIASEIAQQAGLAPGLGWHSLRKDIAAAINREREAGARQTSPDTERSDPRIHWKGDKSTMKLYVVLENCSYDPGAVALVGVFNDEARAEEVAKQSDARYRYVEECELNAIEASDTANEP